MFGSAIIVFRETLEAALLIGIIAAATRGLSGRNLWLAVGVAAGLAGSLVVAGLTETIAEMAEGAGQELFNAAILGIAVLMLGWHNVWMSRHGRQMARELGAAWAGDAADRPPEPCDAVIDTTPAWGPVVEALKNLKSGGRLVINAIRKENLDRDRLLQLDYPVHFWLEKEIKSVANVTRRDVELLAKSHVVCTLLPGASLHLGVGYAPGRELVDAGAIVALATDFNPGTSPTLSLPMAMSLACDGMRLRPAEAAQSLLTRSFLPFWDASGMAFTLAFLDELVQTVPCYDFGFVPDRSAVDFARCLS